MSVNGAERTAPKTPVWLLSGLIIVLLTAALWVWQYWPQILLQSILWQKSLHQQMTLLLQQVAHHPHQAGLTLMGFSLLYGVLHALGPGHGKVVIATFLATHPTKMKTSLQLTLAAAVVQGGVAIALVTFILGVLQLSSRQLHLSSYWLEKGSYLLIVGLGVLLCWRALKKLWQTVRPTSRKLTIAAILPVGHQHNKYCGCGHQHVPDSAMLSQATGWKTKTAVVLSMGLRPCSGAIMMLLFSKVIGVYVWGVLSALAMALGTALTVSAMALVVQLSRSLAQRLTRKGGTADWHSVVLHGLALTGGVLLVAAGVILWLSEPSATSGGLRPIFMK